ncbi:DUF262 domain-containing protein [Pseudomonas xionganensis]|uniref:DUF262 domain-containing protein n=1 Tax=Pseudomonas xionganensis TaxID=2654845 RepID=A0A6I4KZH3_9PSED|nr:DUF262 domain-containing protein [Pseudomonas xionganensis]MVW77188.1 DUF262 domain-containing protein [Pseudomonas xionganensis]
MQTGKSTVKDIFDGTRIFNVPTYQRAYSWEREDNLEDFLNDLCSQHPERPYFLGSFLFHLNGNKSEFALVDIVDGQQRLTTLVIFMHVLLGRLIEQGSALVSERTRRIFVRDGDIFKLESANEGNTFLHDLVLGDRLYSPEEVTLVTHSQRLLLDARQYFEEQLGCHDLTMLEKIYTTAVNADVLLYVVDKISMATQIFELLNDRGRRLTDLESIKSFLMYNAGVAFDHPEQVIGKIQEDFSEIYRLIESHKINDRDVLRYHMLAFEPYPSDYTDKPKAYIKERIIRLVSDPEKRDEAREQIREYPARLKKSFQLFAKIRDLRLADQELAQTYMIGRVAPFYPALMKVYSEKASDFHRLVAAINAFTFRSSLARLRSNGESYQYTCMRNGDDVVELIERFVQENWWNVNGRAREALDYENYYDWLEKNVVRYILFSYENNLRDKKGFPLLSSKDYASKDSRERLSIEHITAKRVKSVEFDDEFREQYLNALGNLVIDHAASNSSKGRKDGHEKLAHYSLAPLMSQNELNDFCCDWDSLGSIKEFIKRREDRLKTFISTRFGV